MRFVIYNGGQRVAELKDAVPAAKVATMFGAGTEVFVRNGDPDKVHVLEPVAQIDVTGQVIDPAHLERESARIV